MISDSACGYSQYADAGVDGGSSMRTPRMIVGGWEARIHEFPYQVIIKTHISDRSAIFYRETLKPDSPIDRTPR